MNPAKVHRERVRELTDLPNVGPRIASVLTELGIERPSDLIGRDAFSLYRDLCRNTGDRQDPCVLDVFLSITRFVDGDPPRPWWSYTAERKRDYPDI